MKLTLIYLALAAYADTFALQKRGASVIIGYRSVHEGEAQRYRDDGGKYIFRSTQSSAQLGDGAYLSPSMGQWPGPAPDKRWYCAILADSTAWDAVRKVYMPKETANECPKPLWLRAGIPNRPAFIKALGGPEYTIANTVLISPIEGQENLIQFLVPAGLLTTYNPLGIVVQCAKFTETASWEALRNAYGTVDWGAFKGLKTGNVAL